MDHARFDSLARLLATSAARRTAAGSLAALFFGGATPPAPAATCRKPGKKCGKGKDCCDGARCKKGKCRCKSGYGQCGKTCARLDRDPDHCGACGLRCAPGETCRTAACSGEGGCPAGADSCAPDGYVACGDRPNCSCVQDTTGRTRCADSETNDGHCGVCTTDADCEGAYGEGAICVRASADVVTCCPFGAGLNTCMLPCPA